VPLTFSTDADYWVEGKTRGEVCLEFLKTWTDAGIPNADILRAMTTNGLQGQRHGTDARPDQGRLHRGPDRRSGQSARGRERLEAGAVRHEGRIVFKSNGVMTPGPFFNGGPVNGWRIR
jgi:hypothetical protein